MLLGQFEHSLDVKGRMNFPAKLREDLGDSFIVTKGLDDCLFVYSFAQWSLLEEKMKALPSRARDIRRFFFASAITVEPDKQGRILIPQNLRDYAHLDRDVTVVGVSDKAEIWDKNRWNARIDGLTSDSIAAELDGVDL